MMHQEADDLSPVFVVGIPRSGTHLMRYCLSRHSNLYVGPETGYFFRVYGNRKLIPASKIKAKAYEIIEKLYRSGDPSMKEFEPLKEQLVEEIQQHGVNYRKTAEIVLGGFAAQKQKKRWGEKTPWHLHYIGQIRQLFPKAKIICMNRDIKNVVASYLKSSHMPDDFAKAAATYLLCQRSMNKWKRHLMLVQYEDLLAQPEAQLRKVADYIGETYEEVMLNPGMIDSSYEKEVMKFGDNIGIMSAPQDKDKWKQVLTEKQVEVLNYLTGNGAYPVHSWKVVMSVRRKALIMKLNILKNRWGYINIFSLIKKKR